MCFLVSIKAVSYRFYYLLIKDSTYEKLYGSYDFLETKRKHFSFERYFHFTNDHDFTIYLDNDIFVYPDSQELPKVSGLMNVREPEGNSSKIFREVNNLDQNVGYFNSGVTMCDKRTAKILSNYMINRLDNRNKAKGKNSDNMLLNEFIIENRNIFTELGNEWNYMPFLTNSQKIKNPNFFHFVGIHGKNLINELQKNRISILDFLKELKK